MDAGQMNGWAMEDVVTAAEIRQQFDHLTLPATKPGEVADINYQTEVNLD